MGKFTYRLKNLFKSKEQIEMEAAMAFKRDKRSFTKYYNELDESIKNFSKMAYEAELSGNHANAVSCANFVTKLERTQIRVQGLLQRFEMMHSMHKLSGVMTRFMSACAEMGVSMDVNINLKSMWKDTAQMSMAIDKLDAMSEQMDMVFESIDEGMSAKAPESATETIDMNAEAALSKIVGRYNELNGATSSPASATSEEDRLARMLQDLKE